MKDNSNSAGQVTYPAQKKRKNITQNLKKMISNVVDAISFLNAYLIFEKNTFVLQRILISFTVQLRSRKSQNKNKKITQAYKKVTLSYVVDVISFVNAHVIFEKNTLL